MAKSSKPKKNERERGPRSGGPRTETGRAKSSANALRHGVLSEKIVVLERENEQDYYELKRTYYESLNPVGFLEAELVDEIVWAKWRQMRSIRCETATFDLTNNDHIEYWEEALPEADVDLRTARATKVLVGVSQVLQHLNRYETRFHRVYHRSLRVLLELQEKRRQDGQTVEPVAPPARPGNEKTKLPNEQPSLPQPAVAAAERPRIAARTHADSVPVGPLSPVSYGLCRYVTLSAGYK